MSASNHKDRGVVTKGILIAWIISVLFIGGGWAVFSRFGLFREFTPQTAFAFTVLIAGLTLLAGIGRAAQLRHFSQNIDGSAPVNGSPLDITRRYISNTVEQLLLFVIGATGLLYAAPDIAERLLPIMGVWFLVARLMFWVGYHKHPLKRAVGFAATFHPTIFLFGLAAYQLITQ